MELKKAGIRRGLVLGTVTGAALALVGAVGDGTASAATSLSYTCTYPLIGKRGISVDITTSIPAKIGVNQPTGMIQTAWKATLGEDTTEALKAVDAATIQAQAVAKATVNSPDSSNLSVTIANAMKKTVIPDSGSFTVDGFGQAPRLTFTKTGRAVAALGDLDLKVTLLKQDGSPTGMGTFAAKCTPEPGQDTTVASTEIVQGDQPLTPLPVPDWFPGENLNHPTGTLKYGFDLSGSSYIKAPNGTVPLSGTIDVDVDGGTGAITGDLVLNKTRGNMKVMGFLPVVAEVDFEQVGKTVGSYANGEISTTSTMYVKLPKFTLFGVPLSAQSTCRTTDPSVVKLNSPAGRFFNPKRGGKISTPDYTISKIQDCGALTPILSTFTAGSGNTIDLDLTPKA